METEVDNIAPKIVGILGLSETSDAAGLRAQLVEHCKEYMEQLRSAAMSKKEVKAMAKQEDSAIVVDPEAAQDSEFQAYICPNAGASNTAKKQRLIFRVIDRDDVYSVLDVGKVADIVLMVMSCKNTVESKINDDPWQTGAIDEQGYRALGLLRAQATVSLVGVLQHLECISSKR